MPFTDQEPLFHPHNVSRSPSRPSIRSFTPHLRLALPSLHFVFGFQGQCQTLRGWAQSSLDTLQQLRKTVPRRQTVPIPRDPTLRAEQPEQTRAYSSREPQARCPRQMGQGRLVLSRDESVTASPQNPSSCCRPQNGESSFTGASPNRA